MFCQKCGTQNPDNGRFCRNCGIDLAGMAQPQGLNLKTPEHYIDRRGRIRSNNPDDLWSSGIRNTIMGIGFLIVAFALLTTGVANGHKWWWAMLFPAFSLLAGGIGSIAKSKRLEKKNLQSQVQAQPPLFAQQPTNSSLPPVQTDYVKPQSSIYDTGEFAAPSSVVEGTTRHLEIDNEGETMTLPKK